MEKYFLPLQKIARLGLLKKISYFFILSVDIPEKLSIINHAAAVNAAKQMEIAGLCKGSTTDSDSVCEGSNPSPAASLEGRPPRGWSAFCFSCTYMCNLLFK